MATAGTVTVDFAAETAKFTAELKKVQTQLGRLETSFTSLSKVASIAQRVFAGGVLLNLAKSAFDAADATADAANRAGIAVESFSRLQFAAKMTDSSIEAFTTGVKKLQITVSEAAAGNKQAAATLGLFNQQAEALSKLPVEEQLAAIADEFAKISDPAERTRRAVELFGRSAGPELVPLLAQGGKGIRELTAEADRLGVTMTSQGAAAIDHADAAIKRLTATVEGWKTKFVAGLSIVLLGPPDEFSQTEKQIDKLQVRIQQIRGMTGGFEPAQILGKDNPLVKELADAEAEVDRLMKKQAEALALTSDSVKAIGENLKAQREAAAQAQAAADVLQPFDLATIRALKIETNEWTQALLDFDKAVTEVRTKRAQDVTTDVAEGATDAASEFNKQLTVDLQTQLEEQARLREYYRNLEVTQEQAATDAMKAMRVGLYASAIDALQTFAGQSETVARALVIINKFQAVAQAIQNTAVAVTAALALGPAGIPLAATMKAIGAAQIALILASGYGQLKQIGSHGAPIGTPVNPVRTQTVPTAQEQAESADRVVQVIVNGNLFSTRETVDYLIDAIRDEIDTKDVVLFSPSSRQAEDIRGAPG